MYINLLVSCIIDQEILAITCPLSTFVLSVATLVVSIVNAIFIGKQTKINKTLAQLKIAKEQPVFIVRMQYEKDSDDDKWGTEHLFVKQVGFPNIVPKIEKTVLFQLTKVSIGCKKEVSVKVNDYFHRTHRDDLEGETIYHTQRVGNHRFFCDLNMEALQDKKENGVVLFFDKIILVHVEYTDIQHTKQFRFFINKDEVEEKMFADVLSKVNDVSYSMNELKYGTIKALLPEI